MSSSDVIVLGAGVIGAAVAFELSAAGYRVRVVDARRPGQGATQASAGVLSPYIEGHESEALSTLGRRSLDLYDAFVGRVAEASGRSILYQRSGTVEVALHADHAERLQRSAATLSQQGIATQWLSGPDVASAEPAVSSSALGALVTPIHGLVGVMDLTTALVSAAERQGAIIDLGTRAQSIEPNGTCLRVATDAGRFEATHVVLAAGSWSGQVAVTGADPAPVRPVRGQLLVLRQPHPTLTRVVWGRDCYLVPWPDGTVLVGATMEEVGFDERATVDGVAGLMQAARALVPALGNAVFEGVRVGLRPAGPDPLPVVGRSARVPGLIYASGHFRNGALLTPLTAALAKDLVDGRTGDPALAALAPARMGL